MSAAGSGDLNEATRSGGEAVAHMDRINKASIVMLDETGLVPRAKAAAIAGGILRGGAGPVRTGAERSVDYLDFEPRLEAEVGEDASRLHTRRSRQDMGATIARMNLRDTLLQAYAGLVTA